MQYEPRGGEARYRLLETVRQYSEERLLEAGEAESLRARHYEWFVALAEELAPETLGPNLSAGLDRLDAEHDNLRAALEWSRQARPEVALRLAGALWAFWTIRGHLSEGQTRLSDALERAGTGAPTLARARAAAGAAALAHFKGDLARMEALCEEGLALSRAVESKQYATLSLIFLGFYHHYFRHDHHRAKILLEEGLVAAREVGDRWIIGAALCALALGARERGEFEEAGALLEESLGHLRAVGNEWLLTLTLANLAIVVLEQGDCERAAALCRESLGLQRHLADKLGTLLALIGLAGAVAAQGQTRRAAQIFGAAETLREARGVPLIEELRTLYDRLVAVVRGALDEAEFAAAWADGRRIDPSQVAAYALEI